MFQKFMMYDGLILFSIFVLLKEIFPGNFKISVKIMIYNY